MPRRLAGLGHGVGCGGGQAWPEGPMADRTHLPAIAGPGVTLPPGPGFGAGSQALSGSRYKVFCPASPWLPGLRGPSEGQCRRGGGGKQMPVGPPCRQHKHGLSLAASVSSLPYIPARPPPPHPGQGGCVGPAWGCRTWAGQAAAPVWPPLARPPGGPARGWPSLRGRPEPPLGSPPVPPVWWLWVLAPPPRTPSRVR